MRRFSSSTSRFTPSLKNLTKTPQNATILYRSQSKNSIPASSRGKADEGVPQTGAVVGDPAEIVAKALLCFNDKYIYSSCEESYRLAASGNLDVPPDYADTYCNGPCLSETHLVLNCIEGIMINFLFYNKATIQDIRDTIQAGCGYGRERGNFNVAEHVQAESSANKAATHILLGSMIIGLTQSLYYL